ncbi:MAG: carboxypeptidase-like regulatory domain-containing protein, partial [Bacteroidota bacterium]|nr:carboxypeptidase-like regulatory domain-containing protein [Bacteroidota bacterium]
IFRGRVTDADNNGVPFANVTNVQDNNAGTYTDARGYFNLIYPDSVLTVQVKSIGFENNNVQLRNSVSNNQVVLQDDRKTLSEVVLSKQKPNAIARSRDGNMKLEEPEPADGWDNYDTYLTNNLEVPKDLKNKQNGSSEVQVSFEVDKNGEPVNIRLEKSLCAQCDKEAIRLVKEGPKWKRKAKKGRTTVTISF